MGTYSFKILNVVGFFFIKFVIYVLNSLKFSSLNGTLIILILNMKSLKSIKHLCQTISKQSKNTWNGWDDGPLSDYGFEFSLKYAVVLNLLKRVCRLLWSYKVQEISLNKSL